MLRRLVATAALAASPLLAIPTAHAVIGCEDQKPCLCGTEIAVGLPDKDPVVSLGRIDC